MKIYVASHVDREGPEQPLYATIRTGAGGTPPVAGILRDDAGDHISGRNPFYCELTALYWIWKNTSDERVGLCHYRRFFSPILFPPENRTGAKVDPATARALLDIDPGGAIFGAELSLADMVVPVRDPAAVPAAAFYAHHHRPADWQAMMSAMRDLYPAEAAGAQAFFSEVRPFHHYNMMVTHRAILDLYCSWLFPLLFHLEGAIVPSPDSYQRRVYGFLAERLFNWWTASRGLRLVERPVIHVG